MCTVRTPCTPYVRQQHLLHRPHDVLPNAAVHGINALGGIRSVMSDEEDWQIIGAQQRWYGSLHLHAIAAPNHPRPFTAAQGTRTWCHDRTPAPGKGVGSRRGMG